MGTPPHLSTIFTKGDTFCDSLFAFVEDIAPLKGSTFKEKNLLLWEQIIYFKSGPY